MIKVNELRRVNADWVLLLERRIYVFGILIYVKKIKDV